MNEDVPTDFAAFMKEREAAARAFVNGDFAPSHPLLATAAPATFFDPWGACHEGPQPVLECYERNASLFASGSCAFQTLQLAASGTIGYWVFIQRGTLQLKGATEAIPGTLRVTEIFRREEGGWKLVHRHADRIELA